MLTAGAGLASAPYMNTATPVGTWHDNFIRGFVSYAESRSPRRMQYLAQDYWSPVSWGNAPSTKPQPTWVEGKAPTWTFLYNSLARNAAVDVLFMSTTGSKGHYVSVTGLTWDTSTNSGSLAYVNPWNGQHERTGFRLGASGTLTTDYFGVNGSWIGLAEAIAPFPGIAENSSVGSTVTSFAQADTATTYALVPTTSLETQATPWMRMGDFLTFCRGQDAARSYPLTIQGRLNTQNGAWECRGVFEPWLPTGISYWYEWGRTKQQNDLIDAQRKAEGYSVLSQQTFLDAGSTPIYQTVWVRNGLATAQQHLATLQAGTIPNDNASFSIVAGQLKTANSLDYEAKNRYSIRVRATQVNGLYTESTLTVGIADVNEAPTGIAIAGATVPENQPAGSSVGILASIDSDAGDAFTYSLVAGVGSTDNASFAIIGNALRTTAPFNCETKNSYAIRVRSTDRRGLWTEKAFAIGVTNVNEAPTVSGLSNSVAYSSQSGPILLAAAAVVADVDSPNFNGGTLTAALTAGALSSDQLSIINQGTSLGQIGVSGSTVTYGGKVIGVWTGGVGTVPLSISLNSAATPAAVQALLRSIRYKSTSSDPSSGGKTPSCTVRTTLSDTGASAGGLTTSVLQTLAVRV